MSDSASFEKISIELPVLSTGEFDVVKDRVKAVYSRANSNFPGHGCVGTAVAGTVLVEERGRRRVHVQVRVAIAPLSQVSMRDRCPAEFADEGDFEVKSLAELTPWLGGPAASAYEAGFP